jgi:hypothetical protein
MNRPTKQPGIVRNPSGNAMKPTSPNNSGGNVGIETDISITSNPMVRMDDPNS